MSRNSRQSTAEVAALAARILADPHASAIAKSLAGSVVAQTHTRKQSGADLETRASQALRSPRTSPATKTLAGSVLSQANKLR